MWLLLLAVLLVWQPCGAPPVKPGQTEELKLPVVRDTVKVCRQHTQIVNWSTCSFLRVISFVFVH